MKFMLTRALALVVVSLLIVLSFSRVSLALTLDSIKDGRVLVSLDGSSAKVGDTFLVSDTNGKKRAFVKVTQVKGNKALATILKGKLTQPANTYVLQTYAPSTKSARSSGFGNAPPSAWGILAGYSQNAMSVKTDTVTVDMKGSGFTLEGLYERQIDGAFQMMARIGYQTLSAAGQIATPSCLSSTSCAVDISYLGFDGLVKYSIFTQKITYWLAGGLGFSYAMSKSSNVLDVSKISVNQKILADLGLNYYLSRTSYIPVQFEYAMYPNNAMVTSSQMTLRLGYGQTF